MQTNTKEAKHLILRVIEYAIEHQEFKLGDIEKDLKLNNKESDYLRSTLTETQAKKSDNPNHILVVMDQVIYERSGNTDSRSSTYTLVPQAYFNYVDHQEVVIARQAARDAANQASIAMRLAIYAIYLTLALGVWQIFFDVVTAWMKK